MSSSEDYEVIVFVGGAGGEHCAAALGARRWHVALVPPAKPMDPQKDAGMKRTPSMKGS
jgi:hypothetical protein